MQYYNTKPELTYEEFLKNKIAIAPSNGFEDMKIDIIKFLDGTELKPHQRDAINWALIGGRRALFESFGLGKTIQQLIIINEILKKESGKGLIVAPLGVQQEFKTDAKEKLGIDIRYIKTLKEAKDAEEKILITNYERVRDGDIDPVYFTVTSLDEASILRGYGTKTYQSFLQLFKGIKYKYVATATPSPNKYKELIHYAGYLEIMDTGQALTRFFQRDSTKANNLTLYPHKEEEFWLWVSTWALFITKPSDFGYDNTGYDLPPMDIQYHELPVDHSSAGVDKMDGQVKLFRDASIGLKDASKEKRDSIQSRVDKAIEIIKSDPDNHYIIWHDQEAERHAIKKALPEAVEIYGSLDIDLREKRTIGFSKGEYKYLASKPVISGQGCNFQRHCHKAIFLGISYKFNDFIQAIHRIYRFLQDKTVEIHIIYTESEREILRVLEHKWEQYNYLVDKMIDIIKKYGLSIANIENKLTRTIGITRIEKKGNGWKAINNDSVLECAKMEDNSIDLIHTSIPFGNHYEYTPSYNDLGHNENNETFFKQMDYLTPELLRILKPGRVIAIHVKDRVLFGNATGNGMPTMDAFHAECILHYRGHGFAYFGMITVVTDVVRENNQTYRLGWTEQCKDGTKMGVGCPEYILLFRKLPTDKTKAYADVPVKKSKHYKTIKYECSECKTTRKHFKNVKKLHPTLKEKGNVYRCPECKKRVVFNEIKEENTEVYTRARWQIDAHAFWRSSGNRFLENKDMRNISVDMLQKYYTEWSKENIYNYDEHVKLADDLESKNKLPATFMVTAVGSHSQDVWDDVSRMHTLNSSQARKEQEKHICPLQFDIVDRIINRYSNKGEIVLDPFAGLMTVPYRALKLERSGIGIELNHVSFKDGIGYLRQMEDDMMHPTLFDFEEFVEKERKAE